MWESYFDSVEMKPHSETWDSPARMRRPHPKPNPEELSKFTYQDVAHWLVQNVLCDPSKINSFLTDRLSRDLMYGSSTSSTGGMYCNESSVAFDNNHQRSEFNLDIAYANMLNMCNKHNAWEQKRMELIKS